MNIFRKSLKIFVSVLVLFVVFGFTSQIATESTWFTSSLGYIFSNKNFHVVRDGKLYRSGSLNQAELSKYIETYGIKTVVDLRYSGDKPAVYGFSEKETVEHSGAQYQWIPLVGTKTRQRENIERLVSLAKSSNEPVLIHCSSGTHRSGVASAIWLMAMADEPPDLAAKQLSPEYGYFFWERRMKSFFLGHDTIDAIIWRYLDSYHRTGINFVDWLKDEGENL